MEPTYQNIVNESEAAIEAFFSLDAHLETLARAIREKGAKDPDAFLQLQKLEDLLFNLRPVVAKTVRNWEKDILHVDDMDDEEKDQLDVRSELIRYVRTLYD